MKLFNSTMCNRRVFNCGTLLAAAIVKLFEAVVRREVKVDLER